MKHNDTAIALLFWSIIMLIMNTNEGGFFSGNRDNLFAPFCGRQLQVDTRQVQGSKFVRQTRLLVVAICWHSHHMD